MEREHVDTIIIHGDLYTMEGEGVGYIGDGAVAIADGKIVCVDYTDRVLERYNAIEMIDAYNKMVLPGFVDAHIHTSQTMMRGMAQDTRNWMIKGIEPLRYYMNAAKYICSSKVTVLEALASGTTTFGESGSPEHIERIDEFYHQLGVRNNYAVIISGMRKSKEGNISALYDLDDNQVENGIAKNMQIYEKWKNRSSRVTVNLGVHAPDTVSRDKLIKCKEISRKFGIKINMHVAQGDRETDQMMMRYGKRSIPFLDELGYIDKDLIAIHLTEATEEETKLMAKKGASMVVCSGSIGIIDGVVPPTKVFQDAGGVVALGTDQSSGNNCNRIINEMKLTALFNKIKYKNPEVMPAWKVLRMATIEGAKAIGLDHLVGSIVPGKRADIVIIDLKTAAMAPVIKQPYRNLVPNLVYSACGDEVCRVMVDGKTLYKNGKFINTDFDKILEEAQTQSDDFYQNTKFGEEIKLSLGCKLQEEEKL